MALFFEAIKASNLDLIKELLDEYPFLVNKVDDNGYLPFYYAINTHNINVIKLLYKYVGEKYKSFYLSVLEVAHKNKHMIIDLGREIQGIENIRPSEYPMHEVIWSNYIGGAKLLFSLGYNIIDNKNQDSIPLHYNVRHTGYDEMISSFAKMNSQSIITLLRVKDKVGYTPLHYICKDNNESKDYKKVFDIIADKLSDDELISLLKIRDKLGYIPLYYACNINNKEIIKATYKRLGNNLVFDLLKAETAENNSFFHLLCQNNYRSIIGEIFRVFSKRSVIELLKLENGAGYTPMHIVCAMGHNNILQLVVDYLDNQSLIEILQLKTNDRYNDTALHIVCRKGRRNILETLFVAEKLDKKDIVNLLGIKNAKKLTPSDQALKSGYFTLYGDISSFIQRYSSDKSEGYRELVSLKGQARWL